MLLTFSLVLSYTTRATAALTRLNTQTLSTRDSVSKSFSADTCWTWPRVVNDACTDLLRFQPASNDSAFGTWFPALDPSLAASINPVCDGSKLGYGLYFRSCHDAIEQIAKNGGDDVPRIVKGRGRGSAAILLPRRWLSSKFSPS